MGGANIQIVHYFGHGYLEEEKSMIAYFLCTVVLSTSEKIAYMYTFKIMFDTSVIQ
jgi:hypothetical protein